MGKWFRRLFRMKPEETTLNFYASGEPADAALRGPPDYSLSMRSQVMNVTVNHYYQGAPLQPSDIARKSDRILLKHILGKVSEMAGNVKSLKDAAAASLAEAQKMRVSMDALMARDVVQVNAMQGLKDTVASLQSAIEDLKTSNDTSEAEGLLSQAQDIFEGVDADMAKIEAGDTSATGVDHSVPDTTATDPAPASDPAPANTPDSELPTDASSTAPVSAPAADDTATLETGDAKGDPI